MSRANLSPAEREAYARKKRALDRLVAERKISRAEAKDRMAQSLADRASEGRSRGRHNQGFLDNYRRSSAKRKLPNMYLLTLLEPETYMTAVPDPFSLFPRTVERIKTSFVMKPDATGSCGVRFTGGNQSIIVSYGTATFNGTTIVAGAYFSPYKWSTFDHTTSGAATKFRMVASKMIVEYEGPMTDSAGRIACAEYPPDGGLSINADFDSIASYDYSYSGPVAKGCSQISLPVTSHRNTEFIGTNQRLNQTHYPELVFNASGLTGGGIPPAGENRLVVTIVQVYEFFSIDPILTGSQKHSPPVAMADHANQVLGAVHHYEGGLNGKAKHGKGTAETIWKYWKKYTWDQRHWMWDVTKEYGPAVADFAIDLALAA